MADEYTPTTDIVRSVYTGAMQPPVDYDEAVAEFNRWLAAHDAEAERRGAVKALREANEHLDTWPDIARSLIATGKVHVDVTEGAAK